MAFSVIPATHNTKNSGAMASDNEETFIICGYVPVEGWIFSLLFAFVEYASAGKVWKLAKIKRTKTIKYITENFKIKFFQLAI